MDGKTDPAGFLTPENRARIARLCSNDRMLLETYATICGSLEDFEALLSTAERKAAGQTLPQIVEDAFIEMGLVEHGSEREALVTLSHRSTDGRLEICRVHLGNKGGPSTFTVNCDIGLGLDTERWTYDLDTGDVVDDVITLDAGRLSGGTHFLDITVRDSEGALLTSVCGWYSVMPEKAHVPPQLTLTMHDNRVGDDGRAHVADIKVKAESPANLTILVNNGAVEKVYQTIHLLGGSEKDVSVYSPDISGRHGRCVVRVRVLINGEVVEEGYAVVDQKNAKGKASEGDDVPPSGPARTDFPKGSDRRVSSRSVEHRVDYARIIDVNDVDGSGNVKMCQISIRDVQPGRLVIHVELSGDLLYNDVLEAGCGWTSVNVMVPARLIRDEESHTENLSISCYDSEGCVVFYKSLGVMVHSKYDLHNVRDSSGGKSELSRMRWAQFVNPLLPEIRSFVADSNGALAREMGSEYHVSGYQDRYDAINQLEAVFNAVRNMGISYVSMTSAAPETNSWFQCVRWPDKVLADKSANCAEFSVLFASILEAMDLRPLLVFPPMHVMPGIQVVPGMVVPADIPTFTLDVGGSTVKAVLFESTLARSSTCSFREAVRSAAEQLAENMIGPTLPQPTVLDHINRLKDVIDISSMRNNKSVKPLV